MDTTEAPGATNTTVNEAAENTRHARKRILWGAALVIAGCVFLLDRMDILDVANFWQFWHIWPIFIVIAGLIDVLSATKWKHITEGSSQVFFGAWLFVCIDHIWGFTFGNSWPLLLIGSGVAIVCGGLARRNDNIR